jgi:acetyltransferase-like isoleucine patch superfamily enzyme
MSAPNGMQTSSKREEVSVEILASRIDGTIEARDLVIGKGVVVEEGALISGKGGIAERVVLGDFCFIGRETRILAPSFSLGDYSKLHAFCFGHGGKPLHIGRNCWIGGNVVLDSTGGLDVDDNVGIGAHSQIWTHIQFGDIVEGSRFYSNKYMYIGKDAWFVGHCIVSPVSVGDRSMAMVGSVVTKDMLPNHIYAGVPAKDVTERLGPQFEDRTVEKKASVLQELIDGFERAYPEYRDSLMVAKSPSERHDHLTWFDVSTRTYNKRYRPAEVKFLKAHTPLVKFIPDGSDPFVVPQQPMADARPPDAE